MSVKKRGSTYWMYFTFNGNRIQRSTKCTSKREAQEVEHAYRTQLAKGEVDFQKKKNIPTFSQAVKDFLTWSKNEHKEKPNTVQGYANSCKHLLLFFKDQSLDKIEPQDVERYKIWRLKHPTKNSKIAKKKSKELKKREFEIRISVKPSLVSSLDLV